MPSHGAKVCFTVADLEDTTALSEYATVAFCLLAGLAFVPQYAKVILRESADGVSFWTLALAALGYALQVDNLVILHYDQIRACYSRRDAAVSRLACDHSLTTLYYVCVTLAVGLPLYPLCAWYARKREGGAGPAWSGFGVLLAAIVAASAPILGVVSTGSCAPFAGYAVFLGVACGITYAVMYIPQVVESIRLRGALSLSYVSLALHFVLGCGAAVQKAVGTKERPVTWVPPLVATGFQGLLLVLNAFYCGAPAAPGGEDTGSLRGGSYGSLDRADSTASSAWGGGDDKGSSSSLTLVPAAPEAAMTAGRGLGRQLPPCGEPAPALFTRQWWAAYL